MKTLFEQKMTFKALKTKFDDSERLFDSMLEDPQNADQVQKNYKNVCCMLSKPLTERLENTLKRLDMSKREFLELAIVDALDKAAVIVSSVHGDKEQGEAA